MANVLVGMDGQEVVALWYYTLFYKMTLQIYTKKKLTRLILKFSAQIIMQSIFQILMMFKLYNLKETLLMLLLFILKFLQGIMQVQLKNNFDFSFCLKY